MNISRYRSEELRFSDLLERLLGLEGDFRLRISSLEPDQLDERFFDLLHHPRMTPHLHLCLQSGSERILLQMRRQYSAAQYQSIVDTIRKRNAYFNITTDIIVGFPNETTEDFAASQAMVERNGFGHTHIFPYAIRSGTRAARMDGQQTSATISARCKQLKGAAASAKRSYRQSVAGLPHRLLTESEQRGTSEAGGTTETAMLRGYSQYYVPLQTPRRQQSGRELSLNSFYPMTIERVSNDEEPILYATALEDDG